MCMHACVQSLFSRVQHWATLWTVAHWAPLSKGFSRQEYWSGLPCPHPGALPNPGTEPMTLMSPEMPPGKPVDVCVCVLVAQSYLTLCNNMDCSLPGSFIHGILQARILERVAISFSRDLPNPGIEPRSPALQADSLPSEPPGKPPFRCICTQTRIFQLRVLIFIVILLKYNIHTKKNAYVPRVQFDEFSQLGGPMDPAPR